MATLVLSEIFRRESAAAVVGFTKSIAGFPPKITSLPQGIMRQPPNSIPHQT